MINWLRSNAYLVPLIASLTSLATAAFLYATGTEKYFFVNVALAVLLLVIAYVTKQ